MIIIGYQAIGKTSLATTYATYTDLESTNTWFTDENGERKRWPNWAEIYVNFAVDLSDHYGHTVFVSSHQVVRDELKKRGTRMVAVVCPRPELKDQWIEKLQRRYDESGLDKDYRALMNAKDRYVDNINEMANDGFPVFWIDNMDYKLWKVIDEGANRVWPPMSPVEEP